MALRRDGLAAIVLTLALSLGGVAQTDLMADPRVKKTLEALKWSFKTDSDGDYSFVMETDENRTQLVIVRSRTFSIGKLEQRELWSAAGLLDGEVPPETARALLSSNLQEKVGFWCSLPQDENKKQLLMYVARIPADCDPQNFAEYCQGVADIADSVEGELGEKDQF